MLSGRHPLLAAHPKCIGWPEPFIYGIIYIWCKKTILSVGKSPLIRRVGQNRIFTHYMTVYQMKSLLKTPYIYGSGQPYTQGHVQCKHTWFWLNLHMSLHMYIEHTYTNTLKLSIHGSGQPYTCPYTCALNIHTHPQIKHTWFWPILHIRSCTVQINIHGSGQPYTSPYTRALNIPTHTHTLK